MITEKQILDSMKHIMDPDLGQNIVSLGFIKNLKIDGDNVSFTVELTTPACPMKAKFKEQCEHAVMAIGGVESVNVSMSSKAPQHRPHMNINTLEKIDTVIAVSSCKGGVGKSTIAAHLAIAMKRQGLNVGLLDADIFGPSIPTLFNIHDAQVIMTQDKLIPVDIHGVKVMSLGFMIGDSPAVMRGPMVSGYIQQLLTQTDWGKLDYLIIDMPPGTGDIQLTLVQRAAIDGALIVSTPQALSLVDVAKGIVMFEKVNVPVLGIVDNMSYFVCDKCDTKHYIFGQGSQTIKERFGIPTLAELPMIQGVSNLENENAGMDIQPIQVLADNLHREIGKRRIAGKDQPSIVPIGDKLHIRWPDGHENVLQNREVRLACKCAQCVSEYTGDQLLDPDSVPEKIEVFEIQPLGNYAISIAWSDGHSSGIYAWEYLKDLAEKRA